MEGRRLVGVSGGGRLVDLQYPSLGTGVQPERRFGFGRVDCGGRGLIEGGARVGGAYPGGAEALDCLFEGRGVDVGRGLAADVAGCAERRFVAVSLPRRAL